MLPEVTGEYGVVRAPEMKFDKEGKAWAKIRASFKDRKRDSNGTWTDGEPMFIDIVVNHQAEHLIESISVGDSIVVTGQLKIREYEVDGVKRLAPEIRAENVGVSVRWTIAKTTRTIEQTNTASVHATLGATEVEAPF